MSTSDIIQVVALIGPLVGLVITAVWWCLQRYISGLLATIRDLSEKVSRLEEEGRKAEAALARAELHNAHLREQDAARDKKLDETQTKLHQVIKAATRYRAERDKLRLDNPRLQALCDQLTTERARHVEDLAAAQKERQALQDERDALARALHHTQERLAQVATGEEKQRERAEDLERQLEQAKDYDEEVDQLQKAVAAERERADDAAADVRRLEEQIGQVIAHDGRVWERPVSGVPFLPLADRRVPVIAVVNLKGGVGKTTITGNLAGTVAQRGQKVVVVDADYQRTLSMMLVSDRDRKVLHLEKRTLQHFLRDTDHSLASLSYCAHAVSDLPQCWVVTNSDAQPRRAGPGGMAAGIAEAIDCGLEDVEMRLMAEWLLRPGGPDARLHLRQALHDLRLHEKGCRYVLVDCPPRLSTACVNALAASDFVLVPVLLDATSARSVPNLLRHLRRLREGGIFPDLRVLGVVANRVTIRTGSPIAQQRKTWAELPAVCRAAWGEEVHRFEAMIPETQRFADSAGGVTDTGEGSRLAFRHKDLGPVFLELLQELERRIDHESQRLATLPA